jgi:hypothetical protein
MAGVQRFKVGDRVQLNTSYLGLPARAQGTIVHIFLISGSYDVRFDATGQRRTVEQRYLELVDKPPNRPADL